VLSSLCCQQRPFLLWQHRPPTTATPPVSTLAEPLSPHQDPPPAGPVVFVLRQLEEMLPASNGQCIFQLTNDEIETKAFFEDVALWVPSLCVCSAQSTTRLRKWEIVFVTFNSKRMRASKRSNRSSASTRPNFGKCKRRVPPLKR
jgi:hypothetical protein